MSMIKTALDWENEHNLLLHLGFEVEGDGCAFTRYFTAPESEIAATEKVLKETEGYFWFLGKETIERPLRITINGIILSVGYIDTDTLEIRPNKFIRHTNLCYLDIEECKIHLVYPEHVRRQFGKED